MARTSRKRQDPRLPRPGGVSIAHGDLITKKRFLAQATIDCLADITDLPIARLQRPDRAQLFARYSNQYPFFRDRFPTYPKFADFISLASMDPIAIIAKLNESPDEWKDFLDDLHNAVFITRPARSEPVIRLLRDHWPWRWVETLAIYDHVCRYDGSDHPIRFYDAFAEGVWLSALAQRKGQSDFLLLGPIKNKALSVQLLSARLTEFVERYTKTCTERLPPLYSPSRYEQFFHEKPSIYRDDLLRQRDVVANSWSAISSIVWPPSHTVDYFDITAITEFTFLISGPLQDVLCEPSDGDMTDVSISYHYPSFLRLSQRKARRLSVSSKTMRHPDSGPPISFDHRDSSPSDRAITCLPEHPRLYHKVNDEFERLFRRRRIAQAQRLLEELLLLRYRMTDSFGVLTASDHPHSTDSPSNLEDSERIENNLGRRIARIVAEGCSADSAIVYKYDHRKSILSPVGAYIDDPMAPPIDRADYRWMEDAGRDEQLRKKSVAYAAVQHDRSVEYNDSDDFPPLLLRKDTMVHPPVGSRPIMGRAIIAVPIKVFGRLWGIFEAISSRANWFSYVHIEWMEKVAELVGPYYHEQLIINMLYRQIATPVAESAPTETDEFDTLAERAADIFLTEAACIWVRDLINTDEFKCGGITGREDMSRIRASDPSRPPSLSSHVGESVAIMAIRQSRIWVSGEIGKPPFAGRWLELDFTRELISLGFRYIAITPVYDLENKAIAVISLYATRYPFVKNWESWAQYLSRYVGAVISRVHKLRDDEWRERRLVAHEVSNAVRTAQNAADKVAAFVRSSFSDQVPRNIQHAIADIKTHLNDVETGIAGWSGRDQDGRSVRPETVLLASAIARAKVQPVPKTNFRIELNTCVMALRRDMRRRGLDLHVDYPRDDLILKIHPENLRMILNNLITNAVKYSAIGSEIRCGFFEQPYSIRFYMKNLAIDLLEEEQLRIFDFGFRGRNAQQEKIRGSGLGLYIVKRICDIYGISVAHMSTPTHNKKGTVWHQFNLDFSDDMVDS